MEEFKNTFKAVTIMMLVDALAILHMISLIENQHRATALIIFEVILSTLTLVITTYTQVENIYNSIVKKEERGQGIETNTKIGSIKVDETKTKIELPIPLGEEFYLVNTTCGDFCLHQRDKFRAEFPSGCSEYKECHTIGHEPIKLSLTINTMHYLASHSDRVFLRKDEAKKRTEEIVEYNKEVMRKKQFSIDDKGYSIDNKI